MFIVSKGEEPLNFLFIDGDELLGHAFKCCELHLYFLHIDYQTKEYDFINIELALA